MYLHIGQNTVIPYGDIIGVFDLDNVSSSYRTRYFLEEEEEAGRLTAMGERIPVSLVVTVRGSYLSPISSQTLCKRLGENSL